MFGHDLIISLGLAASRATAGYGAFAVDAHEDGHWVELATFASKADAEDAISQAVDAGASAAHLRVRKLHRERND